MEILDRAFTASATLEAKQYHYVKLTGAKQVGPVDNASDKPIGILQNHPPEGGTARVRMLGESKLRAGATSIPVGADVGTDNTGKAVEKSSAGAYVPSRALTASADPSGGDLIDVTVNTLALPTVPA